MRRVQRPDAPSRLNEYLRRKEEEVVQAQLRNTLNIDLLWKQSRQTKVVGEVALGLLQTAMGERERCMYCLDAHGTDIEHFRPKARYPKLAFQWKNWLLCCSECGRIKGSQFPVAANGRPLLIDPSLEDPWQHLEFDPDTGNMVARYDVEADRYSAKGQATATVLKLARRGALEAGYRRTYKRLVEVVEKALASPEVDGEQLITRLCESDDHGLLPWCFHWSGQRQEPFASLKQQHPRIWRACLRVL